MLTGIKRDPISSLGRGYYTGQLLSDRIVAMEEEEEEEEVVAVMMMNRAGGW